MEDNRINQIVAAGFLQQLHHKVQIAENGHEALAALQAHSFDVVLMDIQMPVMDGWETIQRIREAEQTSQQHQLIVAVTAEAMKGDRERCLQAGADDYLAKPITQDSLSRTLERVYRPSPEPPSEEALLEQELLSLQEATLEPPLTHFGAPLQRSQSTTSSLDLTKVNALFTGGDDEVRNFLALCAKSSSELLDSLQRARDDGDLRRIASSAHQLKTSAGYFNEFLLVEAALAVEIAAREGRLDDALQRVDELTTHVQRFLHEVDHVHQQLAGV